MKASSESGLCATWMSFFIGAIRITEESATKRHKIHKMKSHFCNSCAFFWLIPRDVINQPGGADPDGGGDADETGDCRDRLQFAGIDDFEIFETNERFLTQDSDARFANLARIALAGTNTVCGLLQSTIKNRSGFPFGGSEVLVP